MFPVMRGAHGPPNHRRGWGLQSMCGSETLFHENCPLLGSSSTSTTQWLSVGRVEIFLMWQTTCLNVCRLRAARYVGLWCPMLSSLTRNRIQRDHSYSSVTASVVF